MTQLQEMIYNLSPSNFLDKPSTKELLDIFFKVVDGTCKIAQDIPDYVNIETDVLSNDIMQIYLQNIWQVLQNVKEDVLTKDIGGIPHAERKNYCYSDLNLGLQSATDSVFVNNDSVGLQNIDLQEEIIVQEYFNGIDIEYNKRFMLVDNTGVNFSTTVNDAVLNNKLTPSELCCTTIPCATTAVPSCSLGTNLNEYINSYTGSNLAADILDQLSAPGTVTDCLSKSPAEDIATETPYKIGSNWMYIDFYIGQDYIDQNLSLNSITKLSSRINKEHIWSSKDFKQNLGHAKAFYFTYNIIKEFEISTSNYFDDLEYIELEEKRTPDGKLIPFNYLVKSLIHEYIYDSVIHPVAHPVGYNGEYKKVLGFNFDDNFCHDLIDVYDVFFVYCIESGKYFDIRDGSGLFGNNGLLGHNFRYNTEISNRYVFTQHGKSYIRITLDNGYSYRKDFTDQLVLIDPTGVIVKTFHESCGLTAIKTRIKCQNPTRYIETIDNERTEYNTTDPVTLTPATEVYRIDFNNDGALEGGFLSDEHTIIYLDNNVQYHIANGRIQMYNSLDNLYAILDNCKILYNGLEQKEIVLCEEILFFHITMKMIDCIPHHLIIQEDPSLPASPGDSQNLDLSLNQTDSNIDINQFILDYISLYSTDDGIQEHILNHLSPPGPINVTDESLQGIDTNNNNVPEELEYNKQDLDWGWVIGADKFGVLPPNYDKTDINAWVNQYSGNDVHNDIFTWLSTEYNKQHLVSPRFGSFEECAEYFPIDDFQDFGIEYKYLDSLGITDLDYKTILGTHLSDNYGNVNDNINSWALTEKFEDEYVYVIIDGNGTYTPAVTEECSPLVDINTFITNYTNAHGTSNGISSEILNQSTAPGICTDCDNTISGENLGSAFIQDSSTAGGFYVGDKKNVSGIFMAETLTITDV